MTNPSKRSVCPVACTLDLIGDRWTMLVVRDLFAGKAHFKEFARSPEGIATNILASRLAKLVNGGIAEKYPSQDYPGRDGYRLTDKGHSLGPVLAAMADWGLENIEGTEAKIQAKI
jgi:DNA-binding HxlR family transcriptional regulator